MKCSEKDICTPLQLFIFFANLGSDTDIFPEPKYDMLVGVEKSLSLVHKDVPRVFYNRVPKAGSRSVLRILKRISRINGFQLVESKIFLNYTVSAAEEVKTSSILVQKFFRVRVKNCSLQVSGLPRCGCMGDLKGQVTWPSGNLFCLQKFPCSLSECYHQSSPIDDTWSFFFPSGVACVFLFLFQYELVKSVSETPGPVIFERHVHFLDFTR